MRLARVGAGEKVLILRPSIINLDIAAPDIMSAGMSRTYTTSAGQMTLLLDIIDGTTKTLMVGETLPSQCAYGGAFAPNFSLASTSIPLNTFQTCPRPPGCHKVGCGFKSEHPGGAQFAMGDGSVTWVEDTIETSGSYGACCSPWDRMILSSDEGGTPGGAVGRR